MITEKKINPYTQNRDENRHGFLYYPQKRQIGRTVNRTCILLTSKDDSCMISIKLEGDGR